MKTVGGVTRCTMAELDRSVECGACGAQPGRNCRELQKGLVHFGRRLRALRVTVFERRAGTLVVTDRAGTGGTPLVP